MVVSETPTYQANIEALRLSQPDVAELLERTPVPDDVQSAIGRDGCNTYRLRDSTGEATWFGRSSMPSISAVQQFIDFRCNEVNVVLPGILNGQEVLVLATKIAAHRAVFVLEERPLDVKLAVRLYDYSELISAGRLVFLIGSDVESAFRKLFEARPGFEMPAQLVHLPQRSGAELAELQRKVEQAAVVVNAVQARAIESHCDSLTHREPRFLPDKPRLALVSADPNAAAIADVRRFARAAASLGLVHEVCLPDRPDKCHVVARIEAIGRSRADLVLLVDGYAGILGTLVGERCMMASVFGSGGTTALRSPRGDQDRHLFVCDDPGRNAVAGVHDVAICPPAADPVAFHPQEAGGHPRTEPKVLVLANVYDDSAAASGVVLDSHLHLWKKLQAGAARAVDTYTDAAAERILEQAQKDCRVVLREASLRGQFLSLLQTHIVPAALVRAAVAAVKAARQEPAIHGPLWMNAGAACGVVSGPWPAEQKLNKLFNGVTVVVLPFAGPAAVQAALDALAVGCRVVLREPDGGLVNAYPDLANLSPSLHTYSKRPELTDCIRRLIALGPVTGEERVGTRAAVMAEHTVAHRLSFILDHLRTACASRDASE